MANGRVTVPLSEVLDLVDERVVPNLEPDGVHVGLSDLDDAGEPLGLLRPLAEVEAERGPLRRFRECDLLLARPRGGSKVWLADRRGACSTSFLVLRPRGDVDPRYLKWYLRLDRAARALGPRPDLSKHYLRLPSGDEVVATIDMLEGLAEAIVLRSRALAATQRLGPALFQARFGDPLDQGGRWSVAPLRDVVQISMGWSPRCADRQARDDEWGVIKVSAVSTGSFRPEENKALPRDTVPREKLELRPGDLLMVRSNTPALVGVTAIVDETRPRLLISDKVWRLKVGPGADPQFLRAQLSHPSVRDRLTQLATGSLSSMRNLTQAKLLDLRVKVPPLELQLQHADELRSAEQAARAQLRQAAALGTLQHILLEEVFGAPQPDPLADVVVDRALFVHLSLLQQALWRAIVSAEAPLGVAELSSRLTTHLDIRPNVDALRRALDLLTAAGVAIETRASPSSSAWEEAGPYELTTAS